jgi:hypothetical protein
LSDGDDEMVKKKVMIEMIEVIEMTENRDDRDDQINGWWGCQN